MTVGRVTIEVAVELVRAVGANERAFGRFVAYDRNPTPAASMMSSMAAMRNSKRERRLLVCLWIVTAEGIGVSIGFRETGTTD